MSAKPLMRSNNMHSRIFLVSKDKEFEIVSSEDICNEMTRVDWVDIQEPEELTKDIDWLKNNHPEFDITNNSFQMSEKDIEKFQYRIREERKNKIYEILKRDPLTDYDFWEISREACPVHGLMFKFEDHYTKSVESFVLDGLDNDRFYIIASYDYHF